MGEKLETRLGKTGNTTLVHSNTEERKTKQIGAGYYRDDTTLKINIFGFIAQNQDNLNLYTHFDN